MIETRAAALMERSTSATQTIDAMLSTRTDALLSGLTTAGVTLSSEFDTRLENLSRDAEQARPATAWSVRNARLHA